MTTSILADVRTAATWEVTLLRRPPGARRPRVAGLLHIAARSLPEAVRQAEAEIDRRRHDGGVWSLGVLRPPPGAPGTHLFTVTFAIWQEKDGDHFERIDVHELPIWAADAGHARRLAQQEAQALEAYRPAWRIRAVARHAAAEGDAR